MCPQPAEPHLLIDPDEVERFDRGGGVATLPYVGKWNSGDAVITTGQTVFQPGTGPPPHSHNVEESVLILDGEATAEIDGAFFDLEPGQATWVPAGVPQRFLTYGGWSPDRIEAAVERAHAASRAWAR
ncbi:cupin domain-containing protein [Streptomyces scopuliridis]|uniref:cupin domain-containing protein n=1 Tax=Streptomyces scopuliridis TaxID=452529 RepID=UPI0036880218